MKEYILSKPGLILMAIPSTMFFLIELDMIPYDNEELCCVILALCMIIVMVSAFIHCGWHGIWIGPLRIVIGITCGGLIVWSLFGLMATLILGAGGGSGATYHEIVGNGRRRHVHLTSGGTSGESVMRMITGNTTMPTVHQIRWYAMPMGINMICCNRRFRRCCKNE